LAWVGAGGLTLGYVRSQLKDHDAHLMTHDIQLDAIKMSYCPRTECDLRHEEITEKHFVPRHEYDNRHVDIKERLERIERKIDQLNS
jgi:hypothetical protein